MNSFEWSSAYLTGILNVDNQHKRLVELVNQMGDGLSENTLDQPMLTSIFHSLSNYAIYHFEEEEQLMVDKGVDNRHIKTHEKQHKNFIENVTYLFQEASISNHAQMESILDFLVHWLAYHILGIDKLMAKQIAKIEAGVSPEKAYEKEELGFSDSMEPLLKALNGLFHQLQERNLELIKLNQSLEDAVEERTKELSYANRKLKAISVTDVLTDLHNRRYALQVMEKLWNEDNGKHDLSCIMIDADHFKEVNDTYGHDAGDKVLCELARTLESSVRSDDFVCRLGGDEFLIICPKTEIDGAEKVARQAHSFVSKLRVEVDTGEWKGSISVGVASKNQTTKNVNDLLKLADKSVYIAKNDGKNCVRTAQRN